MGLIQYALKFTSQYIKGCSNDKLPNTVLLMYAQEKVGHKDLSVPAAGVSNQAFVSFILMHFSRKGSVIYCIILMDLVSIDLISAV